MSQHTHKKHESPEEAMPQKTVGDEEKHGIDIQQNSATINDSSQTHGELKDLIEKNIKWSQVIYNQNKKIKHRLTLMVVGSYLRLVLILAPIILGIIYLPPLLNNLWNQYSDSLGLQGVSFSEISDLLKTRTGGTQIQIDANQLQELLKQNTPNNSR
ncbi:MAG TPA: hypothetical protein DCS29_03275 [Candidatus Magasanikbacteria bacterium]|nr:MAG: hypothetical protein A2479_02880 [Candidatus Magasanikbacteria bacterium RIFOXYC2_FULL_39_8]HAT03767.1 hypothetical protein [Candidatus Magasanikbacteria bacterium]